jgi:hypothetical protein
VDYNKMLAAPDKYCQSVVDFVDMGLNVDKMRAVPNERLYRNRVPIP